MWLLRTHFLVVKCAESLAPCGKVADHMPLQTAISGSTSIRT